MTRRNLLVQPLSVLVICLLTGCASDRHMAVPAAQVAASAPEIATSVLDPDSAFTGRPFPDVGLSGLFPVRDPGECQVAVLAGGEDSFAVRLAALNRATSSIRTAPPQAEQV